MKDRKVKRVYCYFAVQIGTGAGCIDLTIDETKHRVEMFFVPGGVLVKNKRQNMDTFISHANIKYALMVPEDPEKLADSPPMEQTIQITPEQLANIQAQSAADNERQVDANKQSKSSTKEEEVKAHAPAPVMHQTPAVPPGHDVNKRYNKAVTGRPAGL